MPTVNIRKWSGTTRLRENAMAAGIMYDTDDDLVKLLGKGVVQALGHGLHPGSLYCVDAANGSNNHHGKNWSMPKATIQGAIDAASPQDYVLILGKKPVTAEVATGAGEDPPGYGESIIIPATHVNFSLIGVARGVGQMSQPCIRKSTTTTNPLMTVRACGCRIAGLTVNGAGATGGGIKLDSDGSTKDAGGLVISGCHFKNCKASGNASTGGAVYWPEGGSWYVTIEDSDFVDCRAGIVVCTTNLSRPKDIKILGCRFVSAVNTNVDCDIYLKGLLAGCEEVVIDRCVFGTVDVPAYATSPAAARYLDLTGCEGIVSNSFFACTGKTFKEAGDAVYVPTTVRMIGNYQENALVVRDS